MGWVVLLPVALLTMFVAVVVTGVYEPSAVVAHEKSPTSLVPALPVPVQLAAELICRCQPTFAFTVADGPTVLIATLSSRSSTGPLRVVLTVLSVSFAMVGTVADTVVATLQLVTAMLQLWALACDVTARPSRAARPTIMRFAFISVSR